MPALNLVYILIQIILNVTKMIKNLLKETSYYFYSPLVLQDIIITPPEARGTRETNPVLLPDFKVCCGRQYLKRS